MRGRLTITDFWKIYYNAKTLNYPALQIAMGISLVTFMREGDICSLQVSDDIEGNLLKTVIGKSKSQKDNAKAARLQWNVTNYELLRELIQKARELSLVNRRCTYLISYWPKQKRLGKGKLHFAQVTPRRLISMFEESRKMAGFTGSNPPTFHKIRSLAISLASDAGYAVEEISHASSHSSIGVTKDYMDGHKLPFDSVNIQFTAEQIGGCFN